MENTEKKPNKTLKIIIYLVAALTVGVLLFYSFQNRKKAAYTVAFIDMPESFQTQLKKSFNAQFVGKVDFIELPQDFQPSAKTLKKVDLVLMWDGKKSGLFEPYAKNFQPFLYDDMISTIGTEYLSSSNGSKLPLLYDPYILNTLKETDEVFYLSIPEDSQEMDMCLAGAAALGLEGLSLAGKSDKDFLALVASTAQELGGEKAVGNLAALISKNENAGAEDFAAILKEPLYISSQAEAVTLETVLSKIKSRTDFSEYDFTELTVEQENQLMENSEVYADFRQLSAYNQLPASTKAKYNTTVFPPDYSFEDQSLVSSTLIMMSFSTKQITDTIARYLTLPQIQGLLSTATGLVPVTESVSDSTISRLQEYTSCCTSGLTTDFYSQCFTSKENAAAFCNYLRQML